LRRTVATHDAADCLRALRASIELYRSLAPRKSSERVEDVAMEYLAEVERRYGVEK
jgi:hypothetical protein